MFVLLVSPASFASPIAPTGGGFSYGTAGAARAPEPSTENLIGVTFKIRENNIQRHAVLTNALM